VLRLSRVLLFGLAIEMALLGQSDLFEWSLFASIDTGQHALAIVFSPDGSKGAIGTTDGTVAIFDLSSRSPSFRRLAQHSARVVSLGFMNDSSALMSAGEDGSIQISSVVGGASRAIRVKAKLLSATVSRDNTLLAAAADDKSVTVWDIQSGRQLSQLQHRSNKPFFRLGFAEKDTALVGVSEAGVICEWDVKTRALLRQMQDSDKTVHAASIGDNGSFLSIGAEFADFQKGAFGQRNSARPTDIYREDRIKIYDLGRGSAAKTLDGLNGDVVSLALSADGRFVGFIRQRIKDSFLVVYDTQRGVEVASSRLPAIGTVLSFSPQGQWLGTTMDRGDIMVWAVKGISVPVTPTDLRGGKFNITSANGEPLVTSARPLLVAVMDFDGNGSEPGAGRAVADLIRTRLGEGQNVKIVERARMEQIMKEQNFQYSDRVDATTAVGLGRMLGAGKMIFGSLSRLDTRFTINVRMVDVETGVVDGEREVTCQPCSVSDLQEAVIVLKRVLVN
jgi:WD40 repeat protein